MDVSILEVLGGILGLALIVLIIYLRGFLINVGFLAAGLYGIYYALTPGEWGWGVVGAIAALMGGFNVVTMIKDREMFDPWPSSDDDEEYSSSLTDFDKDDALQSETWDSSALDGDHCGFAKALIEGNAAYASGSLQSVAKGIINCDHSYVSGNIPLEMFVQAVNSGDPSYANGDLRSFAKALIEENPTYAPSDLHYLAKAIIEKDVAYL